MPKNDQITVSINNEVTEDVKAHFVKIEENGELKAILLEVTGIEAADMDKVITIDLGSYGTITFSGNDFARMMANSNDQSVAVLGAALYLYGKAAKDCFKPE